MLHDSADHYLAPIADGIHIDLNRVVQKAIEQNRGFIGYLEGVTQIAG